MEGKPIYLPLGVISLLRSRYKNATSNFCWVSYAINRPDLPRFEALAYVVPHFDALTHVVIRSHMRSCLRKALLAKGFLTRELVSIL